MRSKSCRVGFEGLNLRCTEVGALAPEPRPKGGVESEEAGGAAEKVGQRLGCLIREF